MTTPTRPSAGSADATLTPSITTPSEPSYDGSQPAAVPDGSVAMTVRLADPAVIAVVRPGTRVDLLAESSADTVTDALVLAALPGSAFDEPGAAALFVAVPPPTAAHVSNLPVSAAFRVIVRGP